MRCEAFVTNKKQANKMLAFVFDSESEDLIPFATMTFLGTLGVSAPLIWASTSSKTLTNVFLLLYVGITTQQLIDLSVSYMSNWL